MQPVHATPRIAVILTCYNLGRYIEEAVASVEAQSFRAIELVVIDDGSTEPETRRALEKLEQRGVRVIRTVNRGLSAARNRGIAETTAEFICSVDADDRLHPEWLARALDVFADDPSLDFVSHWLHAFGTEDWLWEPQRCDLAALLDRNAVNGAALFRRSVVARAGDFDETMRQGCEDWEFWIRAVAAGCRGAIVPEVMYEYRRRHDSMSVAMHQGDTHARIYTAMAAKHHERFAEYLPDLVLRREQTIAAAVSDVDVVEQEIATSLEPAIAERRRELERGRARLEVEQHLARDQRELAELRTELSTLRQQATNQTRDIATLVERIAALEQSASWRLTAPIRRAYDAVGRRRS